MNSHPTFRIANSKEISQKLKRAGMSLYTDNDLADTNELELKFDKTNSEFL